MCEIRRVPPWDLALTAGQKTEHFPVDEVALRLLAPSGFGVSPPRRFGLSRRPAQPSVAPHEREQLVAVMFELLVAYAGGCRAVAPASSGREGSRCPSIVASCSNDIGRYARVGAPVAERHVRRAPSKVAINNSALACGLGRNVATSLI